MANDSALEEVFQTLVTTYQTTEFKDPKHQISGPELLSGPQAQGDIFVLPTPGADMPYTAQPVRDGLVVPLVVAGNGHELHVRGEGVRVASVRRGHVLAVVDIPKGSAVYLQQPRGNDAHTPIGLAPGRYEVRRQAEGVPIRSKPSRWDNFGRWVSD